MTSLMVAAAAGCLAVAGEQILARDMARGWPEFAAVPEETALGYAPVPGARRIYGRAELARLAARFGMPAAAPGPLCFERPAGRLEGGRVLTAMREALGAPEARIEIVELSRYPAPEGRLAFPRAGLRAPGRGSPAGTPVLWKGWVLYGANRRFPVWARVIVRAPVRRVRAAVALKAGETVRPEQVRLEEAEGFPAARDAGSLAEVVGRRVRRTIPAGAAVPLAALAEPHEVERGDQVRVTVAGPARLEFTARAESSGAAGEEVVLRNPESRRTFSARVVGKGLAEVETGGRR